MIRTNRSIPLVILGFALACSWAGVAMAHPGHDLDGVDNPASHFVNALSHPLSGVDHLLAMVAVGILAARLGRRALWQLPGAFMAMMVVGGLAAASGFEFPLVEQGICLSVLVLGILIAVSQPVLSAKVSLRTSLALVSSFALLHGWAHGAEMASSSLPAYFSGFLISTFALHVAGAVLGLAIAKNHVGVFRYLGGAIAASSLFLATAL